MKPEEEEPITEEERKLNPDDYEIYINPRILSETKVELLIIRVIGRRIWMGILCIFP